MKVVLEVNDQFTIVSQKDFERLALKILDCIGESRTVRLSLSVIDDSAMRRLNKQYRSLDETTDVLAWPFLADNRTPALFDPTDDKRLDLGEIVISYPQLRKQAKQYNCPEASELKRLFIHGFLHLLGYDHQTAKQRATMQKLEELIDKS